MNNNIVIYCFFFSLIIIVYLFVLQIKVEYMALTVLNVKRILIVGSKYCRFYHKELDYNELVKIKTRQNFIIMRNQKRKTPPSSISIQVIYRLIFTNIYKFDTLFYCKIQNNDAINDETCFLHVNVRSILYNIIYFCRW